jgi:hypothetical protein
LFSARRGRRVAESGDAGNGSKFDVRSTRGADNTVGSLVRQYPAGPGIIKEFIQNADDAGATRVDVVMDWRDHGTSISLGDPIRPLLGPALLIANDAIFTDKNYEEIREIGDSGKRLDWRKTGRTAGIANDSEQGLV